MTPPSGDLPHVVVINSDSPPASSTRGRRMHCHHTANDPMSSHHFGVYSTRALSCFRTMASHLSRCLRLPQQQGLKLKSPLCSSCFPSHLSFFSEASLCKSTLTKALSFSVCEISSVSFICPGFSRPQVGGGGSVSDPETSW